MKKQSRLPAIAVLGLLGLSSAAMAASKPDGSERVGTWKVNVEKAIPFQGEVQKPYTVVMRQADTVLDFTFKTQRDGKPYEYSWRQESDGQVHDVAKGIRGKVELLPNGNHQMTMWYDRDGTVEEQVCNLQVGGNQLVCFATFTHRDGSVAFTKVVMDRVKDE